MSRLIQQNSNLLTAAHGASLATIVVAITGATDVGAVRAALIESAFCCAAGLMLSVILLAFHVWVVGITSLIDDAHAAKLRGDKFDNPRIESEISLYAKLKFNRFYQIGLVCMVLVPQLILAGLLMRAITAGFEGLTNMPLK